MFFKALILTAALECGWLSGGLYNYTSWSENAIGAAYTSLEATASLGTFYLGGQMDCYFTPRDLTHFSPFQMTYIVGAGVKVGSLQVGYEHSCFHPMQPYSTIVGTEIKPKYEGGYDRFFVRISTR